MAKQKKDIVKKSTFNKKNIVNKKNTVDKKEMVRKQKNPIIQRMGRKGDENVGTMWSKISKILIGVAIFIIVAGLIYWGYTMYLSSSSAGFG